MAFTVNQVSTILNKALSLTLGVTEVQKLDLTGLISIGDKVLNSSTDKEKFTNVLTNLITKSIFSNRNYNARTQNILMDNMEYGSMFRKIYIAPMVARDNSSWNLSRGQALDLGTIQPPMVNEKIFENRDVWQIEITIPDHQMNTAFDSFEQMGSFINNIYAQIENSFNLQIETMTSACISNFIATKVLYSKSENASGVHAIDLLAKYNTTFTKNLSPEQAIIDADFLKYAGREIKTIISRMETMGNLFNIDKYSRFTPKDSLHLMLHIDYASANATYLQSNTFHKELVDLPNYTEVSHWQGQGQSGEFEETSKIFITTAQGEDFEQSYIIGFAFDHQALGVMSHRRKATSFYNPKYELINHWEKAEMGYFNDFSENAVVFYLGTTPVNP